MGKMYTLQPNESINDHVKDSMDIINHIVELSIGCMRDLANPHEGTFVDMTFNKFMRSLDHIRESIEMLDELCDELEEGQDEIRREYEEKVIQFFNRFMNADLNDEANYRLGECVRHIHEIENHYMKEIQELTEDCDHFRDLAISRNKELEEECERSNQLEEQLTVLKGERDLAKKLAKKLIDEKRIIKEELRQIQFVKDAQTKIIDGKEKYISDLHHEIWELQEQAEYWEDIAKKYADPDGHKVNNPANFCGNCKYFSLRPNDVGFCNNKHADPFIVDPDDASCQAFESNKPNVVIDKPESSCCEHCSHENCDDCAICPF